MDVETHCDVGRAAGDEAESESDRRGGRPSAMTMIGLSSG
jgi:hypothetical protein